MTKAKEPKPEPKPTPSERKKSDPKAWRCDICGADLTADVCPTDGKVRP